LPSLLKSAAPDQFITTCNGRPVRGRPLQFRAGRNAGPCLVRVQIARQQLCPPGRFSECGSLRDCVGHVDEVVRRDEEAERMTQFPFAKKTTVAATRLQVERKTEREPPRARALMKHSSTYELSSHEAAHL
jgi:hypothetical protein